MRTSSQPILSRLLSHIKVAQASPSFPKDGQDCFQFLASLLRAGDLYAQRAHRMACGASFFGDHDFFEELYTDFSASFDELVEFLKARQKPADLESIDSHGLRLSRMTLGSTEAALRNLLALHEAVRGAVRDCRAEDKADDSDNLLQQLAGKATRWDYKIRQRLHSTP